MILAVLGTIVSTGCNGDDDDDDVAFFDEIEPNNSEGSFNLVERNVNVRGTTSPGDVDGFCARVTEQSDFDAAVFPPANTSVFIEAEAVDGFFTDTSQPENGVEGVFTPTGADPGICFTISFLDGAGGPYTLEIRIDD